MLQWFLHLTVKHVVTKNMDLISWCDIVMMWYCVISAVVAHYTDWWRQKTDHTFELEFLLAALVSPFQLSKLCCDPEGEESSDPEEALKRSFKRTYWRIRCATTFLIIDPEAVPRHRSWNAEHLPPSQCVLCQQVFASEGVGEFGI